MACEGMVEAAIKSLSKDEELKSTWIKCFQDDKDKVMDIYFIDKRLTNLNIGTSLKV